MSTTKPNTPNQMQSNIKLLMEALTLPNHNVDNAISYKTLLQEEMTRIKQLPEEIANLEKKIQRADKASYEKLTKDLKTLEDKLFVAQKKLTLAEKIVAQNNPGGELDSIISEKEALQSDIDDMRKAKASIHFAKLKNIYSEISFEDISELSGEELQRYNANKERIKALIDKCKLEKTDDATIVGLEKDDREAIYKMLIRKDGKLFEKKTKLQEAEKKAAKEANNVPAKKVGAMSVERTQLEQTRTAYKTAEKERDDCQSELKKLPITQFKADLKTRKTRYDKLNKNPEKNPAVAAALAQTRLDNINIKRKIHDTVKPQVVKQLKKNALETLIAQQTKDPKIQERLDKDLVNRMKQVESNTPALESAAAYCIAQLEQVSSSDLNALKKKCEKAGWDTKTEPFSNNIFQMSDILELTHNSYLNNGVEHLKTRKTPVPLEIKEALKQQESIQQKVVPAKQEAAKVQSETPTAVAEKKQLSRKELMQRAPTKSPPARSMLVEYQIDREKAANTPATKDPSAPPTKTEHQKPQI
jgi:hypothetical protein